MKMRDMTDTQAEKFGREVLWALAIATIKMDIHAGRCLLGRPSWLLHYMDQRMAMWSPPVVH